MSSRAIIQNGQPEPCPEQFNIARYVLAAAKTTPDKTALEVLHAPGQVAEHWTYARLATAVRGTATGLKEAGLKPGDKLLLRIGHRADFPILFLAAITMGALPVPTSAQLTTPELDRILGDVAAIALDEDLTPPRTDTPILNASDLRQMRSLPAHPFAQTHKDDPAYIVYTSGSSGTPKGVVHAHRAVWARRMMWRGWYDLNPTDRMLHAGAFNWTFTLGTGLMDPWAIGATALVYQGAPNRHIWSELAHGATLFAAAPGVFRQLLTSPRNLSADFSTLRHALSAGEALPEATRMAWEDRTGTDIHEALGMSEVSTFVSGYPGHPRRPGTVGQPQPGRHLAVLDRDQPAEFGGAGVLAVNKDDQGLMLGYYRKTEPPRLPLTGEWYVTGDRAQLASDGTLTYLGRADTLITAGGYRVAPEEIEAHLCSHPDIKEAAVAGIQIKEDVTIIAAFYVADAPIEEAALSTYMSSRTADYKRPRAYIPVASLPRQANGKLKRNALARFWPSTGPEQGHKS
jgi:acyl-coenzyme A synthetase/AMP-(fatty) acid ligase